MRSLTTKRLLAAAFSLVLVLGVAACGDDDDDDGGGGGGEATLDLTIGDSLALTGGLSDFGPPGQKAADLAIEQINAAIEESGADHTVNIVHEDNETNPQAAVQAARALIADGASCIAGAWASADTIPTAQSVTIPEGVLQISPASTSAEITTIEDDGLLNRTPPADNLQGPVLAEFIGRELGGTEGKVLNIGARNDSYGENFVAALVEAWEGAGGTIGAEVLYDPEQPSYNSEAQQIVEGNHDALAIIDFPETFVKVGPALERTGSWDPNKTFITDGLASGDLIAETGDLMEGIRGTAPGTPEAGAASEAFDKAYKAAEPADIERATFDAQNFDAVVLCYLAAVAAGSTDGQDMADALQDVTGPGGDKYSWEQLSEAIEALQNGDDIDYVGAAGEIDLDDNGDPSAGVYDTYTITGGEITPVQQIDVTEVESTE
jgi:ABC-type branched-subunit amino acid transport system substrate-binding protein